MKKAFLTSMVFIFGSLCVQCSSVSKSDDWQTNSIKQPVNYSALTITNSDSDDLRTPKGSESLMLQFLKRESITLGIENLREADNHYGTEIRVWVGFGIGYPRCFILKRLKEKNEAFYVAPKTNGSKATKGISGKTLIEKTALHVPLSGWDEFDRFLKEQGVGFPIELSSDEKHIATSEEELIVVEAKSEALYNMVFFYLDTKTEDGQKALKVCQRIEQEFSIKMGC